MCHTADASVLGNLMGTPKIPFDLENVGAPPTGFEPVTGGLEVEKESARYV
jgi:hypothetical protein